MFVSRHKFSTHNFRPKITVSNLKNYFNEMFYYYVFAFASFIPANRKLSAVGYLANQIELHDKLVQMNFFQANK